MNNKLSDQTRCEALQILKKLCQRLRSITADIFFHALHENGFSDDEKVRLTGPCMRTASSRGWITRTECSIRSKRNHSNLQTVWMSCIFRKGEYGEISTEEVESEYKHWQGRGHIVPDKLADAWRRVTDATKFFPEMKGMTGTYR